jgi:tetratricopeptide (TPR) repeat protein
LLWAQGDLQEASCLYERALEIRRRTLGEEHPDTAATLNNLALPLQAQDEYDEAHSLYERALATYEKTLGEDHPYAEVVRQNLRNLDSERSS